ncbi:MAG TPA: ABC transporter substrate-binding protein [Chloroflexota bacterium]|nr:ABC transporter substrate-binding protein [Chloroflexota bacterium]
MPRALVLGWPALAVLLLAAACAPSAGPPAAPPTAVAAPAASQPATTPSAAGGATAGPAAPGAASVPLAPVGRARVAVQNVAGDVLIYAADKLGYYQQEGLDVEIVPILDATQMTPALATEQIDIAGIGGTAPMWNAVARNVPMKLVLDKGSFRPGFDFNALVVRKDLYDSGQVRRLEDLRGRLVGLVPPGKASGNGAMIAAGLQRVGMSLDDLNIQAMTFADQLPALANGAIDAGALGEPFLLRALRQGSVEKLVGLGELYPGFTVSALCFSPTLYNNRAVARAYVRAYIRTIRDYLQAFAGPPDNPTRAQIESIMAGYTGIDAAVVHDMVPIGYSPNGLPNEDSLRYAYQYFRDLGLITEPISDATFAALWGTELVNDVLADLGRLPES